MFQMGFRKKKDIGLDKKTFENLYFIEVVSTFILFRYPFKNLEVVNAPTLHF